MGAESLVTSQSWAVPSPAAKSLGKPPRSLNSFVSQQSCRISHAQRLVETATPRASSPSVCTRYRDSSIERLMYADPYTPCNPPPPHYHHSLLRQEQERLAEERRQKELEERIKLEEERRRLVIAKFQELREVFTHIHEHQRDIVRRGHKEQEADIESDNAATLADLRILIPTQPTTHHLSMLSVSRPASWRICWTTCQTRSNHTFQLLGDS